jgi:hypothetical protein
LNGFGSFIVLMAYCVEKPVMTERESFLARLGESRKVGLVDVKFFFRPTQPAKPEDIFAALNEIEAAIDGGKCVAHSKWNGDDVAA